MPAVIDPPEPLTRRGSATPLCRSRNKTWVSCYHHVSEDSLCHAGWSAALCPAPGCAVSTAALTGVEACLREEACHLRVAACRHMLLQGCLWDGPGSASRTTCQHLTCLSHSHNKPPQAHCRSFCKHHSTVISCLAIDGALRAGTHALQSPAIAMMSIRQNIAHA